MRELPDSVRTELLTPKRTDDGLEITIKYFIAIKGEVTHEFKTFNLSISNVGSDFHIGDLTGVYECVDLWMQSNSRLTKNEALKALSLYIEDLYDQSTALEFKKCVDGKW
ncbi:MAG: hypothetical protein DCE90_18215 [Pseudanabaena sp.]|nr:MAG: hypothetical protein DCE90_18215 [Pseudanabaena sp.]